MFDYLRDMQAFAAAVPEVVSMELVETKATNGKGISSASKFLEKEKNPNNGRPVLAQAGHVYRQVRRLNLNSKRTATIQTTVTRVDKKDDNNSPMNSQRTFIHSCTSNLYTSTSTHEVEPVLLSDDNTQNVAAGCRWTMTYALVANHWYGRFLLKLFPTQMERELHHIYGQEFEEVQAAAVAKCHQQQKVMIAQIQQPTQDQRQQPRPRQAIYGQ